MLLFTHFVAAEEDWKKSVERSKSRKEEEGQSLKREKKKKVADREVGQQPVRCWESWERLEG